MAKKTKVKCSTRKFYRTVFQIEVLSEEELPIDMCLRAVMSECEDGPYSGDVQKRVETIIDGRQAAKALQKQGSDPGFFGLTDQGEDTEDSQS